MQIAGIFCVFAVLCVNFGPHAQAATTVRPYKFGFNIEEQQHRSEQRDERGIVMGEFGFITADGIYHVTVYATDENGKFKILAMRNYPYVSGPTPKTTTTTLPPPPKKVLPKHNFNTEACSGCFLKKGPPKSTNEPESKGNNFNAATQPATLKPTEAVEAGKDSEHSQVELITQPDSSLDQSKQQFTQPPQQVTGHVHTSFTQGEKQSSLNYFVGKTPEAGHNDSADLADRVASVSSLVPIYAPLHTKVESSGPAKKTTAKLLNAVLSTDGVADSTPHADKKLSDIDAAIITDILQPPNLVLAQHAASRISVGTLVPNLEQALKQKTANGIQHENTHTATQHTQTGTQHPTPPQYTKLNNPNKGVGSTPTQQTVSKTPQTQTAPLAPHTSTNVIADKQPVDVFTTAKTQQSQPPSAAINPASIPAVDTLSSEAKAPTKPVLPTVTHTNDLDSGIDLRFGPKSDSDGSSGGSDGGDLYHFKYTLDYNGHEETGARNGNKEGNYFAIDDDKLERTITYVANEFGFQPHIRWRKVDAKDLPKENSLKDYEFTWFKQE